MTTRQKFVEVFGEEQAQRIEAAAKEHENGVHDNKGSDPFKWALLICIGYQCISSTQYREYHGIKLSWKRVKKWIKENADLGSHDGDCDYLALFAGKYNEYIKKPKEGKKNVCLH